MPRIKALDFEEVTPEVQAEYTKQINEHGRVTNMKRTLGHSLSAFKALMEWYPLHDEVVAFLGERATNLFTHAISAQTDCLICSTFFRRILIEAGENPDELSLNEQEQTVVEFGRQLAVDSNEVSDELYERLARYFSPQQLVVLTAFGGLMIATNVFNNALKVDLDDYLQAYRRPASLQAQV